MIVNQLVSLDNKNWSRKKGTSQWNCYHSPTFWSETVTGMKQAGKESGGSIPVSAVNQVCDINTKLPQASVSYLENGLWWDKTELDDICFNIP